MGFRMRKSIKLGPGVRLNVSHRGAGLRMGGRAGGVSVNTSGRRNTSVGIPGSGIGYSKSWRGGGGRGPARPAAPVAPPSPPKPGLMASGYEKAFYKAVQSFARGDVDEALRLFRESSEKDTQGRALADELFAGIISAQVGQDAAAMAYLEQVVTSDRALPDQLMEKYVPGGGISMPVTKNLVVEVPFGSLAAALTLAEVYQQNGLLDDATGLLQQLVEVYPHPFLVVSLCDLYAEQEAWDEIVEVAAGTSNDDDVTLQVRIYQAQAFEAQGMKDAALEAYKDALKSKKRDPDLLKEARYARGRLYIEMGKTAENFSQRSCGCSTATMTKQVAWATAVAVLSSLSLASAPALAQVSEATLPSACVDQRVEPERVVITCADAGFVAEELLWTDWGQPRARARGVAAVNNCRPDCARGQIETFPIELTADVLRSCSLGRRQYTRVRYDFPADSPFPPDAPGTLDPFVRFPCPREPQPRPRIRSMRVTLTGVSPGSRYYVRVGLRVRVCAQRGRSELSVSERKLLDGETFGSHERTIRFRQRARCQTRRFRWKLRDEFFGVGTYRVTVQAIDADGQLSSRVSRSFFTAD